MPGLTVFEKQFVNQQLIVCTKELKNNYKQWQTYERWALLLLLLLAVAVALAVVASFTVQCCVKTLTDIKG